MDQKIKLLIPLFLGTTSHEAGAVVEVEEEQAKKIVELGQAELVVPDPHGAKAQASKPHAEKHAADPHHQPSHSATALPPTERAATRTEPPDHGHHKKG